ncbi:MAG: outer membrane beta-barrel protein [Flavobacteriia bacterium]|nr:outer membrane beta-barrel protein [Flavobacteriia bacterium]
MKKIILSLFSFSVILSANAQDVPEKKAQAGIVLGAGMNFQKLGTKYLESAGMGGNFTIGANANIRLADNIALCTGLEFDFSRWKYNTTNDTYYRYDDTKIIQYSESNNAVFYNTNEDDVVAANSYEASLFNSPVPIDTTESIYKLKDRKHKVIYATIPLMFTFRTDYYGNLRYFGKFGLRTGFTISSKIDDSGSTLSEDASGVWREKSEENTNMKAKNEVFFVKSAIGIAAGAEWKFSGSTSLLFEAGFYYGFTPLHVTLKPEEPENNHLYVNRDLNKNSTYETNEYFAAKSGQTQLLFKVGILF